MERDIKAAGSAVAAAAGDRGWSQTELARRADVDSGTLGDFLAGRRWPRNTTQVKIEKALNWELGAIARIADGASVTPAAQDAEPNLPVGSGVDPIDLADLTPEDRAYMRGLYERLRARRGE